MSVIKNSITGRDKLVVTDNGVFDAITGRQVGIVENGIVKSITTGAAIATISNGSGGSVDLSFITAGAADILSGKVGADAEGNPVEGTIPQKAAATITPGTGDQTIAAGTYLSGKQTIKGDANLKAENIADGIKIFGVTGTFAGGGAEFFKCAEIYGPEEVEVFIVSGAGTPAVNGTYMLTDLTTDFGGKVYQNNNEAYYLYDYSGSWGINPNYTTYPDSATYYTYSTDPASGSWYTGMYGDNPGTEPSPTVKAGTTIINADVPKTWSGYKAVQSGGIFSFESTLTPGLIWTDFRPQKNAIYTADTMVKVDWLTENYPTEDLGFFAPLTSNLDNALTGQELHNNGVSLANLNGVLCAKFGSSYLLPTPFGIPVEKKPFTFFFNLYYTKADGQIFHLGDNSNNAFSCFLSSGTIMVSPFNNKGGIAGNSSQWMNITMTVDAKGNLKMYNGKTLAYEYTNSGFNINASRFVIGCRYNLGGDYFSGYLRNLFIYNRVLSEAEIGELVDNFGV